MTRNAYNLHDDETMIRWRRYYYIIILIGRNVRSTIVFTQMAFRTTGPENVISLNLRRVYIKLANIFTSFMAAYIFITQLRISLYGVIKLYRLIYTIL